MHRLVIVFYHLLFLIHTVMPCHGRGIEKVALQLPWTIFSNRFIPKRCWAEAARGLA
jgi:hypothetical protein